MSDLCTRCGMPREVDVLCASCDRVRRTGWKLGLDVERERGWARRVLDHRAAQRQEQKP